MIHQDPKQDLLKLMVPTIVRRDPWLSHWSEKIKWRMTDVRETAQRLAGALDKIAEFGQGHKYYGLHQTTDGWVFREWAPRASRIVLFGSFSNWEEDSEYELRKIHNDGTWELVLPKEKLKHFDEYRLKIYWQDGQGERIPAWTTRVIQDEKTKVFNAQVWAPEKPFQWKHPLFKRPNSAPLIYEAHVGMAQEEGKVGTYNEFRERVLPRIAAAGYNTIQLMAVQEHPYYGSFGYHVSSFFAPSSRFGTPEELKALIDAAHELEIAVIMDIVHSHAVKNEIEGISRYDGSYDQFFHPGDRGNHIAWDSRCFNYGKDKVLHFLLSNCRYWIEEFKFDGFRFDGVTSMVYLDHGLGKAFTSYDDYFNDNVDQDALTYLALANRVIHLLRPDAITIAEDVSGMPGLAANLEDGGTGFNFRLAMGIPDYWIKMIKEKSDEEWHVDGIWWELTNKRQDEKVISYSESHDQALVGDKTLIFRLVDKEMYTHMSITSPSIIIDRGIALHKMIRLITLSTAGGGYLNFMGNEFGHPEWIDFPRQGNNWSYHYARRQWSLRDNPKLKYRFMADFDKAMIELARKYNLVSSAPPRHLMEHVADHVIAFERAGLVFVFNFDPNRSFTDYQIPVPAGHYKQVLDSDSSQFGGFARLAFDQVHVSGRGFHQDMNRSFISLYLPNRSAQVFEPVPAPGY